MNNWTKLVVGAVVAGVFAASTVATADHHNKPADAKKAAKKKGKEACKGGCGGEHKEHKDGKAPADGDHPAQGTPAPEAK